MFLNKEKSKLKVYVVSVSLKMLSNVYRILQKVCIFEGSDTNMTILFKEYDQLRWKCPMKHLINCMFVSE